VILAAIRNVFICGGCRPAIAASKHFSGTLVKFIKINAAIRQSISPVANTNDKSRQINLGAFSRPVYV
jgi:hypothetical protein